MTYCHLAELLQSTGLEIVWGRNGSVKLFSGARLQLIVGTIKVPKHSLAGPLSLANFGSYT